MKSKGLYPPSNEVDEKLIDRIVEHEGIKRFAYTDTLGFVSVGIGRCLDAKKGKGLSVDECFYLLSNDIKELKPELEKYSWYNKQNETRKGVLIEMAFNLGVNGLLNFKKMIACVDNGNYEGAVKEMSNSKWATQIGAGRLKDLQSRMKFGHYA